MNKKRRRKPRISIILDELLVSVTKSVIILIIAVSLSLYGFVFISGMELHYSQSNPLYKLDTVDKVIKGARIAKNWVTVF